MYIINIDRELCEGDGDCVATCPNELLMLVEENGVKYATITGNREDCIGCYSCESTCPNGALTITED